MEDNKKGTLIIISGPSGVGKGTLVRKILKQVDGVELSVSSTTRLPRRGEIDGKHYDFITKEKFLNMVDNDGFLEYAQYNSNYYGTPKEKIYKLLNEGKNIILEIDVQGAFKVKEKYKEVLMIFVMPPCVNSLYKRLNHRCTETKEEIEKRIDMAKKEIQFAKQYDRVIVNDSLKNAVQKIKNIIDSL